MHGDRVVIIGAGIGGLTAAALLAARGFAVTVVEKEATPGGKIRQLSPGGRPIDAGPSVFTMRRVFEEIFAAAGADLGREIELARLHIIARHAWDDRATLDLHASRQASADAIGAFSGPGEARRFLDFCTQAERTYRTLERSFLRNSATNPIGLTWRIGPARFGDMANIRPFSTYWQTLGRHFSDPRLCQLFGRYATYTGSSPFQAPATLALIAHVEQDGVWAVKGGMFALAKAVETLAAGQGARFVYGNGCACIETANGHVSGVRLDDGTHLSADAVVANCDPSALAQGMLGDDVAPATTEVRSRDRSLSAYCWVIDAETSGFALDHHNVFFSNDYEREFSTIERRGVPADPTVYVCAPDRAEGRKRLQIIVNARADGDLHRPSEREKASCEAAMMERLARCGLVIAPDRAVALTTPDDFNRLFPGSGGALYGRATHGWAAAFKRPGARTAIPGLYLAGGAAHPGAGVPMAALSGVRAAESLLADRASMPKFHPAATAGGISTRSAKTVASG